MFEHKCVYCNEPFESENKIDWYCSAECAEHDFDWEEDD